jgi:hypothetical protein
VTITIGKTRKTITMSKQSSFAKTRLEMPITLKPTVKLAVKEKFSVKLLSNSVVSAIMVDCIFVRRF